MKTKRAQCRTKAMIFWNNFWKMFLEISWKILCTIGLEKGIIR
jgi:hypothetical protein